ncbi:MAG TPA: hypothetical protein VIC05_01175 [Solirubrobacteraceae bacterium]|jgi:hypothetical protein
MLVAVPDPALLVAVTATRIMRPESVAETVYVGLVADKMFEHSLPATLQSCH